MMHALEYCLSLLSLDVAIIASLAFFAARQFNWLVVALLLFHIGCLTVVCEVGYRIDSGSGFEIQALNLIREGKPRFLVCVVSGLVAGVGLTALMSCSFSTGRVILSSLVLTAVTSVLNAGGLLFAWDDAFDIERFRPSVMDRDYEVAEIASTEQEPIRLAVDEEKSRVFYSTYFTGINGVFSGSIFSISTEDGNGPLDSQLICSSPLLYRTFGMAFHNGDLYVSRAGHASHAVQGRVTYSNLGAITLLRDLDNDGSFEYFHDVLTGIPAARAPDTMHQNNGICFDDDDNLYVAVGSADDRSIDEHPWSGTVLKLAPAAGEPMIFCRGLRNPFGICIGPKNSVFVTDNDCSIDPGDEVNFLTEGGHAGHPFSIPGESRTTGFDESVIPVDPSSNYCGIASVVDQSSEDRLFVFVCDRLNSSLIRLTVKCTEDGCEVINNEVFARVPSPIDVAVDSKGQIFVASLQKKKIYRIRKR